MGAVVLLRSLPQALAALLFVLTGCLSPGAPLDQRTYAPPGPALKRVAVIPFYAHPSYEGSPLLGGVPPEVASARLTRLVADAISERGIAVVPADEVAAAIEDVPRSTAAIDAVIFAELASREFGATGVLLGEVLRFRDLRGASATRRRPASVAYRVTLYEAPEGFRLWCASFDETQSEPPATLQGEPQEVEIRKRWLSAGEIARRGADAVAASLVASQ